MTDAKFARAAARHRGARTSPRKLSLYAAACLMAGSAGALRPGIARADDRPLGGALAGFSGGILAHGIPVWSRAGFEERGVTFNGEIDFAPILEILRGSIHPELGADLTTDGATSYAYADLKYEITGPWGLFFGAGLGLAVHDGYLAATSPYHNALGSRVLFHVPLEAGIAFAEHYRVSIYFEHVSNAYLANPNEGLDNMGLRFGYRF